MLATTDVPVYLRDFNKAFNEVCYRHDYQTVFCDFLEMSVCALAQMKDTFPDPILEERYLQTAKRYSQKELEAMSVLFGEWLLVMEKTERGTYRDALGVFYEVIKSSGKAQSLGQFFTPEHVTMMMAQMAYDDATTENGTQPQTGCDPACGSGRNLLALRCLNPHITLYGIDVDRICALMCTLNLWIHGCKGLVIWGNSLSLERFGAWEITHWPVPRIRELHGEELDQVCTQVLGKFDQKPPPQEKTKPKPIEAQASQLTLF